MKKKNYINCVYPETVSPLLSVHSEVCILESGSTLFKTGSGGGGGGGGSYPK